VTHERPEELSWESLTEARRAPWKVWENLKRILLSPYCRLYFLCAGVAYGRGWRLYGCPVIHRCAGSTIAIGDNVEMRSGFSTNPLGVNHPVLLTTWSPGSFIRIGDDVGISGGSICATAGITIGDGVLIGANTVIVDSDFHPLASGQRRYAREGIGSAPIVVEDNVFIGMNCTILKGVTIGRNAVVGAGSVVSGDLPPYSVAAGNPARVVRELDKGA
jgi:acetyltransferase-like isoleucine patch superfamily enzyme